jgi:hypothetical protein
MAAPDTNAALPEKVKLETPQPPASSDISAMLQQLLSGQDSQADYNRGVKTAQDCQEGHNQTVANFMGVQLSHNDKQKDSMMIRKHLIQIFKRSAQSSKSSTTIKKCSMTASTNSFDNKK